MSNRAAADANTKRTRPESDDRCQAAEGRCTHVIWVMDGGTRFSDQKSPSRRSAYQRITESGQPDKAQKNRRTLPSRVEIGSTLRMSVALLLEPPCTSICAMRGQSAHTIQRKGTKRCVCARFGLTWRQEGCV